MKRLFAGDCLDVLSDPNRIADESVDLIYLDPPFNSKSTYNLPFSKEMIREQDLKPVMAFEDTWTWSDNEVEELERLKEGGYADNILASIVELVRNVYQEKTVRNSMGAYLINMALRLKAMKRVLKPSGSIYLHCDPTASHYLKMLMDALFATKNFRNEIVWSYRTGGVSKNWWARKHDVLFFYLKNEKKYSHNPLQERIYYEKPFFGVEQDSMGRYFADVYIRDVWEDIKPIINVSKERLGYPTQKPIALLKRILEASSNEGSLVLDPFCGCGTTVHAAQDLGRNWIGIDVSKFSVGLIKNRILQHFKELETSDVEVLGSVTALQDAIDLAKADKFEFEKWACGEIGATGMYHDPGQRGADGGVDGIIPFQTGEMFGETESTYAIVQVKGGNVTVNDVKALSTTVRERKGKCGIFVCFERYMRTVNNQREKGIVKDATGDFPFIQGFSVQQILNGERPNLPCFQKAA